MPFPRLLAILLTGALLAPLAQADSAENASRYYEDARVRMERNDAKGAIVQLKNALQRDPRMVTAHLLIGQAYLKKGEPAAEPELGLSSKTGAVTSFTVTTK